MKTIKKHIIRTSLAVSAMIVGCGTDGPMADVTETSTARPAVHIKANSYSPYPANGYVINKSADRIKIWEDTIGGTVKCYYLNPYSTTDRFFEDADFVMDRWGRWFKIGAHTTTVNSDGTISNYEDNTAPSSCPDSGGGGGGGSW